MKISRRGYDKDGLLVVSAGMMMPADFQPWHSIGTGTINRGSHIARGSK